MIVCAIDLSEQSDAAARVAAAIARRLALPLRLIHVVEGRNTDAIVPEAVRRLVQDRADALRTAFGIEVVTVVETGTADQQLVARSRDARLLVVASLGGSRQSRWLLGSTAERVAQASAVPVLVVRDAARIEAWARGERALRVMVGAEQSPSSVPALRWARELSDVGPCELTVVHVVWPPEEYQRRHLTAPMPLDRLRPEIEQGLLTDLRQWAGEHSGPQTTSFVVVPGWGRVDGHLTVLAAEAEADLLVIGTHQKAGVALLWQGSVSRGVLHSAATNVMCVPMPQEVPE